MTRMLVATMIAAVMMVVAVGGGVARAEAQQQQGAAQTPPAGQQVNLNTAAAADLQKLPGIGAAMAARIVDYRQKNGGFKKVEELMNVQGIGEKRFLQIRSQLTVTSTTDTTRQ